MEVTENQMVFKVGWWIATYDDLYPVHDQVSRGVIRALKEAGTTVLVISHKPVLAALADRILVMKDGAVQHFEARDEIIDVMRRQTIGAVKPPAPAEGTPKLEAAQ